MRAACRAETEVLFSSRVLRFNPPSCGQAVKPRHCSYRVRDCRFQSAFMRAGCLVGPYGRRLPMAEFQSAFMRAGCLVSMCKTASSTVLVSIRLHAGRLFGHNSYELRSGFGFQSAFMRAGCLVLIPAAWAGWIRFQSAFMRAGCLVTTEDDAAERRGVSIRLHAGRLFGLGSGRHPDVRPVSIRLHAGRLFGLCLKSSTVCPQEFQSAFMRAGCLVRMNSALDTSDGVFQSAFMRAGCLVKPRLLPSSMKMCFNPPSCGQAVWSVSP